MTAFNLKSKKSILLFLLILLVVIAIFSIISPTFISYRNIKNLMLYSSVLGICTIGFSFVIVAGELDLSTGAILSIGNMFIATQLVNRYPLIVAIVLTILFTSLLGLINGLLVGMLRVNSFLATISTAYIFNGFAFLMKDGTSALVTNTSLKFLGKGTFAYIPIPFIIMLLLFFVGAFTLKYTAFGWKAYAIGDNKKTSLLTGIHVKRIKLYVFVINGFLAGIASILLVAQTGAGLSNTFKGIEFELLAIVMLGGAKLVGGKLDLTKTLLALFIIGTFDHALSFFTVASFWQLVIKGFLLLITAVLSNLHSQKEFSLYTK